MRTPAPRSADRLGKPSRFRAPRSHIMSAQPCASPLSPRTFPRPSRASPRSRAMPTPSAAAEGVGTVVSPAWLADAVKEKERRVRVLDCSWYLPAMARDGIEEHAARRIPGARYFDVDAISDPSSTLPHMLPSASQFAAACDALDVRNDDQIVVYDGAGLFSAARVVDVQGVRTRRRRRAGRRHAYMARSGAAAGRGHRGRCHRARGGGGGGGGGNRDSKRKAPTSFVSAPSSTPRWFARNRTC